MTATALAPNECSTNCLPSWRLPSARNEKIIYGPRCGAGGKTLNDVYTADHCMTYAS